MSKMTTDDVGRLFDKLDEVQGHMADLRVGVGELRVGQEAVVKEVARVADLAKQTNDMTIGCPARNEWTQAMKRLDGIEKNKASIAPPSTNGMNSAAKRSLQLLQILGPWIVIIVGSIYAVSQPKAATEDQVKKSEQAAAQIQQALPQIQAALKVIQTEEQETVLPGFDRGMVKAKAAAPAEESAVPEDERLPL